MTQTIELRNVSKGFGIGSGMKPVLKDISLEVPHGNVVSVIGKSGCGKTTLLKIVGGLHDCDDGSVFLRGNHAFVFQNPALLPWRTVAGNIALPNELKSRPNEGSRNGIKISNNSDNDIDHLLSLVGLSHVKHHLPSQVSGGMQQRVALLRALAGQPDVLLMDEPFSALDEHTREDIALEFQRIQIELQRTVMMVTHSIEEAIFLSDKIALLGGSPGSPSTVMAVFDVKFPRPRSLELKHTPAFQSMAREIKDALSNRASTCNAFPSTIDSEHGQSSEYCIKQEVTKDAA